MNNQRLATIYALLAVACWSTVATAFKLSLRHLTPVQLILIASFSSWCFLMGLLLIRGRISEIAQCSFIEYRDSLLYGLMNPVVYYLLLFYAYDALPAQEAQAINLSWAILMSLLAVPLLGHKLTKPDILAALLCYVGVLIIATRGEVFTLKFSNLPGSLLALASTLIWSLYWIYNRKDNREALLGLALNFSFALPVIVLYSWVTGDLVAVFSRVEWQGIAGGVYVGLLEMGLGFVFWLNAMKFAENTAKIANLVYLAPFMSLFLINRYLGEAILVSTVLGVIFVVMGLLVQQVWTRLSLDRP